MLENQEKKETSAMEKLTTIVKNAVKTVEEQFNHLPSEQKKKIATTTALTAYTILDKFLKFPDSVDEKVKIIIPLLIDLIVSELNNKGIFNHKEA